MVDNCIVIEIPAASEGSQYQNVRDQFAALASAAGATIASNGDLSKPVRVKVVGPAFFDGEHRGAAFSRGEAVKKSNQGDFLIKMRRCRILIGTSAVVPLRSSSSNYGTRYVQLRLEYMRKP